MIPHFAANLTFLFTEIPFMDRFSAAKQAGFNAVEFMFPYEYNMNDIKAQLSVHGLSLVLCNLPAGNWAAGDRGTAANPGLEKRTSGPFLRKSTAWAIRGSSRWSASLRPIP